MLEARGLFRSAICFRSILSRQNGLNRHMEQNIYILLAEKQVFSVFRFFGPIGSLFWPEIILGKTWDHQCSFGDNFGDNLGPPMAARAPWGSKAAPWGPKERPKERGPKKGDNIH